jgi:hypothetical protein
LETVVKDHGNNQRQFASELGIDYTNLNGMIRGSRAVSDDTVDLVHRKLGVALPVSGYAAKANPPSGMPMAVTVDMDGNENIVVVEAKAKAGYVNGLGDPSYLKKLPAYRLPYLSSGTYRDFTVDGFSMFNTETGQIMQGAHVIARSIEHNAVRSSRVHVVVTAHDVLIKRVYPEDGRWKLRSDNQDKIAYPDIDLPIEAVKEIWYVEQLITASIPPRSSTDEMEEMRGELDHLRRAVHQLQSGKTT